MQYKIKTQTTEQKMKTKFRASSIWKKFRAKLKRERKVDFVTGKPLYKGFQVHHCDLHPENYQNIGNIDAFITCNNATHEIIHTIYRYNWEDYLARLAIVFRKMDELNPERKKEHQPELFDELDSLVILEHQNTSQVSK